MKVAIVGSGAWGSTLAGLAKANGHDVVVWSRQSEISLTEAIESAVIVVSAVSMKGVSSIVDQLQSVNTIVVTATKGLAASGIDTELPLLPSQIWQRAFPECAIAVLSGPNLSKEIDRGLPAASVVASQDLITADRVQAAFSSARFRIYTNSDPLGVELGGTLKNVIAIAVGACDGLQLGANAKSALVTRGLAEMIRLGAYWGAKPETFYGLSGLGDLLATCSSSLSRNYQVGYGLAQGKTLAQVLDTLEGTAEGINTTQVLVRLVQQQNISMPISMQVDRLLKGEITPQTAVEELMQRDSKPEL